MPYNQDIVNEIYKAHKHKEEKNDGNDKRNDYSLGICKAYE